MQKQNIFNAIHVKRRCACYTMKNATVAGKDSVPTADADATMILNGVAHQTQTNLMPTNKNNSQKESSSPYNDAKCM